MKIAKDKIKHFCACAVVSCTTAAIESLSGVGMGCAFIAGLIAGVAIGVGKEYGDHCADGNKWDWEDIAADSLGSIVGAIVGSLFALINQ